jgi:hypothetical protein
MDLAPKRLHLFSVVSTSHVKRLHTSIILSSVEISLYEDFCIVSSLRIELIATDMRGRPATLHPKFQEAWGEGREN